ncbi:coproporphyrinogen-III oxidase family protein [Arcanobacterium hippocoleae]|uniref:coproporphyrinogen-III oxidase family protein n=1 Tax=Arcanobacterium hippocoleae TaxID=149017 RepID=UPI00333F703F
MVQLPEGMPLPDDGQLVDPDVSAGFSAYVHIPFCTVRCGYCDFNTYTNPDFGAGAGVQDYAQTVGKEIELSQRVLSRDTKPGRLRSIFFGGGTPTLLNVASFAQILGQLRDTFGFAPDIEITTEANPETVTREQLVGLQEAGINRISFGMQSAVPHVLATLDRSHTPGQVAKVAQWARELDLNFSLDLIYGTPGKVIPIGEHRYWQR